MGAPPLSATRKVSGLAGTPSWTPSIHSRSVSMSLSSSTPTPKPPVHQCRVSNFDPATPSWKKTGLASNGNRSGGSSPTLSEKARLSRRQCKRRPLLNTQLPLLNPARPPGVTGRNGLVFVRTPLKRGYKNFLVGATIFFIILCLFIVLSSFNPPPLYQIHSPCLDITYAIHSHSAPLVPPLTIVLAINSRIHAVALIYLL